MKTMSPAAWAAPRAASISGAPTLASHKEKDLAVVPGEQPAGGAQGAGQGQGVAVAAQEGHPETAGRFQEGGLGRGGSRSSSRDRARTRG